MTTDQYRSSKCQSDAAVFFGSVAGLEMLTILRKDAEPSMAAKAAYGTHEDVKMQMSLNLVDSLAKTHLIRLIESLSLPPSKRPPPVLEPLEDDTLPIKKKKPKA